MVGYSPPAAGVETLADLTDVNLGADAGDGAVSGAYLLHTGSEWRGVIPGAFGGASGGISGSAVWDTRAPLPTGAGTETGGAVLDGLLYTICENGSYYFQSYDPIADAWTALTTPSGTLGGQPFLASAQGRVITGDASGTYLYSPSAAAWTTRAAPPFGADRALGFTLDDRVYVLANDPFAGTDAGKGWRLYRYDVLTDTWSTLDPVPQSTRVNMAAFSSHGRILVTGGTIAGTTDSLQSGGYSFDITDGTWSTITDMPAGRQKHVGAVINGVAYITGGFDAYDATATDLVDSVWAYSLATDAWEVLDAAHNCPDHHYNTQALAWLGRLWVLAGYDTVGAGSDSVAIHAYG